MSYPAGEDAIGELVYTACGGVSIHILAAHRPCFASDGLWDGSPEEYAAAFATYIGYYGTFDIDDDVVIHDVVASSFPNWAGARHLRPAMIAGETLVLRTEPMNLGGAVVVNELHWRRIT